MCAVTAGRPPGLASLADLLALSEDDRRRFELIGGELVERGAATGRHGRTQGRAFHLLSPFDRRVGGPPERPGGWLFATEADIYFDETNTLRPDVAGWRHDTLAELPDEFPIRVLPAWTCEVLSTNKRNDLIRKKRVYHRYRVPHTWILDPVAETMLVYRWAPDGYTEIFAAERGEKVRAEPCDAIELAVGVLFGDDEGAGRPV